jgi:Clp amino terminal domain, pathogenicity island component
MASTEPGDRMRITTTAELLKAVELGIVDKTEARSLLGFGVKRGRLARLQPREGGRFTKGDQVLPMNRFSASARDAMIQAQELSKSSGRGHPDTADLLLAVVQQPDSAAARALRGVGVGEERVRSALAGLERSEAAVEGIGPSAELKTVVETAFHGVGYPDQVGTRQLVLALAACEGLASAALAQLGVTGEALRAELDRDGAGEDPGSL